jgi:hypothetical protein
VHITRLLDAFSLRIVLNTSPLGLPDNISYGSGAEQARSGQFTGGRDN